MKKLNILIFILIFNTFILLGYLVSYSNENTTNKRITANITEVIDGDTIDTNLGRVRLLGINTPEKKQRLYQNPKDFLSQFKGKQVYLEQTNEDKDKYGRMLRYVIYQGINVNKEIIRQGWAHYYSYETDKYSSELQKAEQSARIQELGIWEKSKDSCSGCIILKKLNNIDPGEYVLLGNSCSFQCNLTGYTIDDDSSSHTKKLNFILNQGEEIKIDYSGSIWNDAGDSFYLRDSYGYLVLFYRY
ncbi:thermonuclease family protein [Candidatus Pacearchaeota archaeon]|nr:thermonuclease family protein [Candidatus Pacearchaeota archaeon]